MTYRTDQHTQAKMDTVRAAEELASAIARLCASENSLIPEYRGLGTDGGLWTDEELRDWLHVLFKDARRTMLARFNQKEPSQ